MTEYTYKELESIWNEKANEVLVGKTIKAVRYMTRQEADEWGWNKRPICILFTDGSWAMPQRDDEGNDGGALFINPLDSNKESLLPTL
jgi:hypothetical protein